MSQKPAAPCGSRAVRAALVALLLSLTSSALGDEVTVKGAVLKGKIVNISSGGVEFETEYGAGNLTIAFKDIEAITTESPLLVIHGDDDETMGKILGLEDGKLLLVGDDPVTAARIDVSTIYETDRPEEVKSTGKRLRNYFRFWSAHFDLGFAHTDKTTDEVDVTLGFGLERKKEPTRLLFDLKYLFGRDKAKGADAVVSDNELRALTKGEYDFSDRLLGFISNDFEYDEVDRLSLRWVGKAGLGYRIVKTETATVQLESGGGYVYERFFGGDREEFASVPFGAEGSLKLPFGSSFNFRLDYLPSLKNWTGDYLIRGEASFLAPITKYLSFKASVLDTYDNTPAEDTEKNEVKTMLGISWIF